MLLGETLLLTRMETRAAPFTASAPTCVVTKPDGTTATPTATVLPGAVAAPGQQLSALFTPTLPGSYRVLWGYADGNGQTLALADTRVATWTDFGAFVRRRLQVTAMDLPDTDLESEFAALSRRLLARYPCLGYPPGQPGTVGNYGGLTGDDQAWFDEAVALLVCARLLGPMTTGGANGDLVQEKTETTLRQFAAGPGERQRYLDEAAQAIGKASCVKAYYLARAGAFSPFAVSGPTRTAVASGYPQTLRSFVISLLTDDPDALTGEGDCP